jgi:hypothetical protein
MHVCIYRPCCSHCIGVGWDELPTSESHSNQNMDENHHHRRNIIASSRKERACTVASYPGIYRYQSSFNPQRSNLDCISRPEQCSIINHHSLNHRALPSSLLHHCCTVAPSYLVLIKGVHHLEPTTRTMRLTILSRARIETDRPPSPFHVRSLTPPNDEHGRNPGSRVR